MKRLFDQTALCLSVVALFFVFSINLSAQHGASDTNAAPKLTAEQWQADVRFLGEELPKLHRNAFHRMKREEFEREVKTLHDRVPVLSEDEIIVGMMRLAAMVKDGHTSLVPRPYLRSGIYPIKFYVFSDGLFVQKAAPEYSEAVGARVVKIGNVGADEALKLAAQVAFADNEFGVKEIAPVMLKVPEILAGLKINADKQKLNLTIESGGKQKTIEIKPIATLENLFRSPANWADAAPKTNAALYLKNPNELYWFEYLKDRKTVYVQHNGIANKPDEPVADFYKRVFAFVEANPVERLVVDLRFNGGGNNFLNRLPVIEMIKSKINQRGKFFVIIGRQTFSAAQNFVNQIEKYTEAIFIGEPTAAHPNHYGDNRPTTLPNSKLTLRASTLWWQDLDPRDQRRWTAPEIAAEMSSEDYRSGRDPMLQAVFDYVPGTSFQEMFEAARAAKDLTDFIPKYRAFKKDPKHRFIDTEAQINQGGYWLLEQKRVAEAIEIFKLNVEFYPASANVYDSLGDAYQAAGNKEEAIKAYEKALSIDPNFTTSRDNLRKLKGQ